MEDRNGRALAQAGLRLKPRDMLKLGRLVLNEGKWKGKQIISKQWLSDSLKYQIDSEVKIFRTDGRSFGYGYQWWLGETQISNKKYLGHLLWGMEDNSSFPSPA